MKNAFLKRMHFPAKKIDIFAKKIKRFKNNRQIVIEILISEIVAKVCELSHEYLIAKIGLDAAENEPSEVCRYQHHGS